MLAIAIEYLTGRVYAASLRDPATPEWPPHPARLFSALVAAFHDGQGTPREREALQWLQRQGAPEIAAATAQEPVAAAICFVPTNYAHAKTGSTHPDQRGKQPRAFPAYTPPSPFVHFLWRREEPSAGVREALHGLAARVGFLGRAASLVRVQVVAQAPDVTHVPDERGTLTFRTIDDGRLEEVELLHSLHLRPTPGREQPYRAVGQAADIPATCFDEMVVLRKEAGSLLAVDAALTLTHATRQAFLSRAGQGQPLSDGLSGHGDGPHVAFVALPHVGHEYARGELHGVALVLPRGLPWGEWKQVRQALGGLSEIALPEPLHAWRVAEVGPKDRLQVLQRDTWTAPARTWRSVTPILLDRFPKATLPVAEILAMACARVGLPRPVAVEHGAHSPLTGVPPVSGFRLRRKAGERPRWGVHATLTFDQPVRGPLLLGAGRFFGLGLMRPEDRHAER